MPRKPEPAPGTPTEEQAATYDRLVPMLEAAHREMSELSKKKQDGIVNAVKIKLINRLLTDLGRLLQHDPTFAFVDMLDEETLPQNSDAVLILSQWKAALEQYKSAHYGSDGMGSRRWLTVEFPAGVSRR
jgi:hypothetical protein